MHDQIKITLIRHGISSTNETGNVVGWTDVALSAKGIKQLNQFRSTVQYPKMDRIYSSDLKRAVDTFEILFKERYTLYKKHAGLRENYCGSMENITSEENQRTGFCAQWLKNIRYADEETLEEFYHRVNAAFEEILNECRQDMIQNVGVILHEGSMKCILMKLKSLNFDAFTSMHFPNGLGVTLTLKKTKEGWELMSTEPIEQKKTIRFMLVRHGISTSNLQHRLVGWEDVDLCEKGIEQLKQYKETVSYLDVERFYCSDLLRARKTFDILFSDRYQIYRTEKGLREVYFGFFDGATQEENRKYEYYPKWLQNIRQQDEETVTDFIERVNGAFKEIALECLHDGIEKAGLVLHEGSIKCILMGLRNQGYEVFPFIRIGNGLGVILDVEVSESGLRLIKKEYLRKPGSFNLSLVRHGISQANDDHRFVGWTDVPLAQSGKEELMNYRDTIQYPDVQRYYCSDLLRAKQTWEILFKSQQKECFFTEGFRENYYGQYEDIPIGPEVRAYFNQWLDEIDLGNEEKLPVFRNRIMTTLHHSISSCINEGLESCGVVAHAGVVKIIYLSLTGRKVHDWHKLRVQNGLGYNFFLDWNEGKPAIITVDFI